VRKAIGSTDTRPDADAVVAASIEREPRGEEQDPIVRPFELATPRSLVEAIGLLDRDDPAVRPIGGGTALMLMMKSGLFRPQRLVSLRAIESRFRTIVADRDGTLRIGAMTTLSQIERSPEIHRHAPVIARTMRKLANTRVRNVATIGGHLAHADPHLDLPPLLVALGARLTIAGRDGERMIPIEELFRGYLETTLQYNELIAEVIVPPQAAQRSFYLKWTARSADDWPALGIAVALGEDHARVVVGAATEKPTRLAAAEVALGSVRDDRALRRAGDAAADEAMLISDQHGSAVYKKELLRVLVRRALEGALQQ
jgi:carbon-monoxide dehydrogenase medium subunit